MKKCYLLFLLFISVTSFAQQIGEYKLNFVKKATTENLRLNDIWLESDTYYVMFFKKNTIGVKHAMDNVKEILNANKLSFETPIVEKSYLSSRVRDINDYEQLDLNLSMGKAEVYKSWLINDKVVLLKLNDELYQILISK